MDFSQSINHALGSEAAGIWSLDNNANDLSGYGNNCSLQGVPAPVYVEGVAGAALSFNNNYISCGDKDVFDVEDGQDFTIEVWAKSNAFSSGGGIVSKGSWSNVGYYISYAYSPRCIHFGIKPNGQAYQYVNSGVCEAFDWTHFVGIRRGNALEIWVNGKKKGPVSNEIIRTASIKNSSSLTIGRSTNGYYFKGLIDEPRIYKQALTVSQIEKIYAEGLKRIGAYALK